MSLLSYDFLMSVSLRVCALIYNHHSQILCNIRFISVIGHVSYQPVHLYVSFPYAEDLKKISKIITSYKLVNIKIENISCITILCNTNESIGCTYMWL